MSAVLIELDKLSPDETESKTDSKSDLKGGRFSDLCADCRGFKLHCSYSAPAGKRVFM